MAIDKKMDTFDFDGTIVPLKFTCNCFITMNPSYIGRSDPFFDLRGSQATHY